MTDSIREVLTAFDALPDPDKEVVAGEILRRLPPEGDLPLAALHAAADELFSALDAEEAARADG